MYLLVISVFSTLLFNSIVSDGSGSNIASNILEEVEAEVRDLRRQIGQKLHLRGANGPQILASGVQNRLDAMRVKLSDIALKAASIGYHDSTSTSSTELARMSDALVRQVASLESLLLKVRPPDIGVGPMSMDPSNSGPLEDPSSTAGIRDPNAAHGAGLSVSSDPVSPAATVGRGAARLGMNTVLLVVASSRRPEYLETVLKSVTDFHPKSAVPIVVSEDGESEQVARVVDAARARLELAGATVGLAHLHHPQDANGRPSSSVSVGRAADWASADPYFRLARHYGWALDQVRITAPVTLTLTLTLILTPESSNIQIFKHASMQVCKYSYSSAQYSHI
jgi:hypothetical protein